MILANGTKAALTSKKRTGHEGRPLPSGICRENSSPLLSIKKHGLRDNLGLRTPWARDPSEPQRCGCVGILERSTRGTYTC
eukprot:1143291-Pelagomonas_calceolata.AAC.5